MKVALIFWLLLPALNLYPQSELTFVFLNKKTDAEKLPKEDVDKLMEGHMANINRLASEGKLTAAGPFEGGGGIFVFKSNSTEQVKEWIETDPAVKANRWNVEILHYQPMVGSICLVGKNYEMTSYHFIRFWPEVKKFTVKEAPQLISDHESYWKRQANSIITFASFGEENGDILVTAQPIDENVLVNDPSIVKGLMRFEKRKLWIAKGSFCEK